VYERYRIKYFFGTDDNFFNRRPATEEMLTALATAMTGSRRLGERIRIATEATQFDTYKNREFDNSMGYYQWSTKLDLAHWNSVKWTQEIPSGDKNMVIHALLRIDGKGEFWDAPGMNDHVMLVDSVGGGAAVKLNKTGYMNDAGQLDVRFYVEYKQGAFDSTQMRTAESWKRCPKIKEIEVEYDRPTQTLHHEDR